MDQFSEDIAPIGHVEIGPVSTREITTAGRRRQTIHVESSRHVWRPSSAWVNAFPADFSLSLDCLIATDGVRRFVPTDGQGLESVIPYAWVGGLQILARRLKLGDHHRFSYRVMWFVFQYAQRMQERARRRFAVNADFRVTPDCRDSEGEVDLIEGLLESQRIPHPSNANCQFVRNLGIEYYTELKAAESTEPAELPDSGDLTLFQQIQYGFLALARRHPLLVEDDEVAGLIRGALFNLDGTPTVADEIVELVTERFLTALEPHWDDSTQGFDAWMLSGGNSLVAQIAKAVRRPGGRLDRHDVRGALLELGWRSYEYVALCVEAMLRAFFAGLSNPLNEEELRISRLMYLRQPFFANLSLPLLCGPMSFLGSELTQMFSGDQGECDESAGVLHRLLGMYSWLSTERRRRDRLRYERRRRSAGPRPDGQAGESGGPFEFDDERDSGRVRSFRTTGLSPKAVERLVGLFGVECACAAPDWKVLLKSRSLEFTCARCNTRVEKEIPPEYLRRLC